MSGAMYPKPNKHGSYPDEHAERVEYKARKEIAIVRLLQIGENAWLYASTVEYKDGGMFEPLEKTKTRNTRHEALEAALKRIEAYSQGCAPSLAKWAAEQVGQVSAAYPLQLSLFADDQSARSGGG